MLIFLLTLVSSLALAFQAQAQFRFTGDLNLQRRDHTATLLANGQVLVVGGDSLDSGPNGGPLITAELYDPGSGRWRYTKQHMHFGHSLHTATRLQDGKVLIVAGF